jgi:hypothetical protein
MSMEQEDILKQEEILKIILDSSYTGKVPQKKMNRLVKYVQRRQEDKYITLKEMRDAHIGFKFASAYTRF